MYLFVGFKCVITGYTGIKGRVIRPVHPPYSSIWVTEFNPENGSVNSVAESLISKYGNIFSI